MRPLFEARKRSETRRDTHARADAGRGLSREGRTSGDEASIPRDGRTNGDRARPNQHLDHVPAGAFEATLSGEITAADSALLELLGFASRQDLVGSSLADVLVDPTMLDRVLGHGREGQDLRGVEVPLRTKQGEEVVVLLLCTRLTESVGGPGRRVVGTLMDITERKRRESDRERPAFEDPATGVANRGTVDEHAAKYLDFTVQRGTLLWD